MSVNAIKNSHYFGPFLRTTFTLPAAWGVRGGTPRHARTQAHAHAHKATHTHTHIGRPPQVITQGKTWSGPTLPHKHALYTHMHTLVVVVAVAVVVMVVVCCGHRHDGGRALPP